MMMTRRPFYVLAGPPGAGKTSLLEQLSPAVTTVPEFARRVLAQARASGSRATGDQDPALFVACMLDMACADYDAAAERTVFDRGLPDLLAFCAYYDLPDTAIRAQITQRPYRSPVFFLPSWPEIYETDDERVLDFAGAAAFGDLIRSAYVGLGYDLIEVPKLAPDARAAFVLAQIEA